MRLGGPLSGWPGIRGAHSGAIPPPTRPQFGCMLMNRRYRLLLLGTHPVQYSAQLFRELARHPQLEILVAYCSLQGAEAGLDPDFGVKGAWDVTLLDGYPSIEAPNK